jgi:uncharacterized protein YcbX
LTPRVLAILPQAVQFSPMAGVIRSLYRYPVKGFSPEPLTGADLIAGDYFPCDRLYAVENGHSGFDPHAPAFVSKTRFTVLARIPKVALARTAYDEASGVFSVTADDRPPFSGDLRSEAGRVALAEWLTAFLDADDLNGPLKVLTAPPHRFTDDIKGFVSVINLESVRDLEQRLGRPIDPLRFRANLYVDGWPAWSELTLQPGAEVTIGAARGSIYKPITRCIATHVDLKTGERDIEMVPALRELYGHPYCGVYLNVTAGGRVQIGDAAELS